MSIPTPFNPLGALGAELPYVQPVKTGFGLNDHSNEPSFGFEVSDTGYSLTYAPWKAFLSPSDSEPYHCWLRYFPHGSGSAVLTFEKKLKIVSLQVRRPSWSETKMILYGLDGGSEVLLGNVELPDINRYYILTVAEPAYYKSYKITIVPLAEDGFACLQAITFNAFYKP